MASSARIEELRKKFEENPRRYFAPLANEYRKAGDIDQAIAICREYLPQQPGHMSGHIVYGQALYEAKQAEEAKTVFETALALDPENLIALRHLGDIALLVGDAGAARMWYGRVLEADPRNEEIQAQLASLDQSSAPTPVAPPATAATTLEAPAIKPPFAPAVTATSPTAEMTPVKLPAKTTTPSSAPTVVVSAMKPPVQKPTPSSSPTAEVVLDSLPTAPPPAPTAAASDDLGLEPTQRRFSVPLSTAKLELDSPISAPRETPPTGSSSLEGLETTSMSAPPPAPPPSMSNASTVELDLGSLPAPPATPAPPADAVPPVALDFGTPATPPPPAAPSEAPLTVDLDFGTPTTSATASPPPPPPAAADDMPLLDIGELPAAAPAAEAALPAATEPPAAPPQAFAMDLPVPEPVAAAPEPTPVPEFEVAPPTPEPAEAAASAPDSGPFVTETMAELYLKQGHRDEALKVYRALLEQRPNDASLRAKVEALSPQLAASAPETPSGPTIRELLVAIASRRPGVRATAPSGNGAVPAAAAGRAAMHDALGALFGEASVAPADENAAIALGYAFMDLNGSSANATEPSMDAVLQPAAQPPQSAGTPGFSFDQFFSQRATSEHATQSGVATPRPEESGDDVAQFNRWLQGLKQR